MPSLTHTGSAPHTPILHPASICCSPCSAMSSSVAPGFTTSLSPLGSKVTSGCSDCALRAAASAPPPSFGAAGAVATSRNTRSFCQVRRSHTSASAQTTPRSAQSNACWLGSSNSVLERTGALNQ